MCDALVSGAADARAPASHESLERIAEALGCPVSALHTGEGMPADLVGRDELLTLWGSLKTDANREAVLKLVRAIAGNE